MSNPVAELLAMLRQPPAQRVSRPALCAEPGCSAEARGGAFCAPHVLTERARAHKRALDRPEDQIPTRYRESRFGSELLAAKCPADAADKARRAFEAGALAITLRGDTGTGKALLAAALANLVRDAGRADDAPEHLTYRAYGFRWVSAMDIGRANSESSLGGEPRIVRAARDATVLVVDELGRQGDEAQTDAQRAAADGTIFRIVDARHEANRPTIFTTFLTRDQLLGKNHEHDRRAISDGGLVRRLCEPPHGVIVSLLRGGK